MRGENFPCITVSTESKYGEIIVLDRNIAEVEYTDGVIETITNENDSIASWFSFNTSVKKLHLVQIKSTVTDMQSMCRSCSSMIEFTCSADTSKITNMSYTWDTCTILTSFPMIDTSSVISMENAWGSCQSLTSFPSIDTSNVTSMRDTWSRCQSLTSFPYINNIKSTSMYYTFANCTLLTSHGGLASCAYVTISTFKDTPAKPC